MYSFLMLILILCNIKMINKISIFSIDTFVIIYKSVKSTGTEPARYLFFGTRILNARTEPKHLF